MTCRYAGGELELFAAAHCWKTYVGRVLKPFIGGRILEVGAGIGGNIPYLANDSVRDWTSLEPDEDQARRIAERAARREIRDCRVITGTIADIDAAARFDSILYIDVLEHIADDRAELARAAAHLADGGWLVVLAPAHPFLFSPFDAAVGHHRRYGARSLAALAPAGCRLEALRMLDSAGFFASLANRLLLGAAQPTQRQIIFWDRVLVRLSMVLDRLTFRRFGKTVVAVWRRVASSAGRP